ncbi:MAG: hypothetical protein NZ895_06480 [Archaeoglobaceae archaeon]|nr:hypothetical protein [Archaeoglobaceae archaeon]MCX8152299.1 hypothetical protein [Archaeoglobaceae archaeon]MDW8013977.1 hypothetical protein [Archaeoglobaceae archaeon]
MDKAQTFTLEGITAAIILLLVMYTFFQTSLVVSPTWSELTDAQLRLLAQDALKVLDNSTKVANSYLNDSLQGLISTLDQDLKPNKEFIKTLDKLVFPANYKLEICWVEREKIRCSVLIQNNPTPEAVVGFRYIVMPKSDLPRFFSDAEDPAVFEVRLTLWRP